jgi:hypothetical protein
MVSETAPNNNLKDTRGFQTTLSFSLRNGLSSALFGSGRDRHVRRYAHDRLTEFMSSRGFNVTRHYLGLATAWRAEFERGVVRGRTVGVNAEMDALPGIGHACGHNLIAMAGVGIALALRAALEKHDVPGTVVLLGTPGAFVVGPAFYQNPPPPVERMLDSRGKWRR